MGALLRTRRFAFRAAVTISSAGAARRAGVLTRYAAGQVASTPRGHATRMAMCVFWPGAIARSQPRTSGSSASSADDRPVARAVRSKPRAPLK